MCGVGCWGDWSALRRGCVVWGVGVTGQHSGGGVGCWGDRSPLRKGCVVWGVGATGQHSGWGVPR